MTPITVNLSPAQWAQLILQSAPDAHHDALKEALSSGALEFGKQVGIQLARQVGMQLTPSPSSAETLMEIFTPALLLLDKNSFIRCIHELRVSVAYYVKEYKEERAPSGHSPEMSMPAKQLFAAKITKNPSITRAQVDILVDEWSNSTCPDRSEALEGWPTYLAHTSRDQINDELGDRVTVPTKGRKI